MPLPDVVDATRCMYSTVRNQCGKTRIFGYLPHHGKKLLHGEMYSFPGDIFEITGDNDRNFGALLRDLQSGALVIMNTPTPHYYDPTSDRTTIIKIESQHVVLDDPCWGSYVSSGGVDDGA